MKKGMFVLLMILGNYALGNSLAFRDNDIENFPFVGYGTYALMPNFELPFCTFTMLKHGLLLTAKHCIEHQMISGFNKANLTVVFSSDLFITGDEIDSIILDSGENDFAYLKYKASISIGKIDLPQIDFSKNNLSVGDRFIMPGFPNPKQMNEKRQGVVVKNCRLTGKDGYLPPSHKDPGYHGILVEADCPAFMGQSGSPIIQQNILNDGQRKFTIFGVLTHTFELNADGSVDRSKAQTDNFGSFIRLSNFSLLSLAKDFNSCDSFIGL